MPSLKKDNFTVTGWNGLEKPEIKTPSLTLGQWKIWTLLHNDAIADTNEMTDKEFYFLPYKTGVFSFWNESDEDIYSENDGDSIR